MLRHPADFLLVGRHSSHQFRASSVGKPRMAAGGELRGGSLRKQPNCSTCYEQDAGAPALVQELHVWDVCSGELRNKQFALPVRSAPPAFVWPTGVCTSAHVWAQYGFRSIDQLHEVQRWPAKLNFRCGSKTASKERRIAPRPLCCVVQVAERGDELPIMALTVAGPVQLCNNPSSRFWHCADALTAGMQQRP